MFVFTIGNSFRIIKLDYPIRSSSCGSTTLPPLRGAGPRQTETDIALNYKVLNALTPSFDTAVGLEIWHNYPR